MSLFSAPEIFTSDAYGTKNRHRKTETLVSIIIFIIITYIFTNLTVSKESRSVTRS